MTHLIFYQGLRVIGGTVAEIRTPAARCLFDFGTSSERSFPSGVLRRPGRLLSDGLRLRTLPRVRGIYSRARLGNEALEPWEEESCPVFFLISHMHIDHMGELGMLSDEIPVYMTEESLSLYRALCETGMPREAVHGNCVGIRCGEPATVGNITFTALPVDHDVPGACAFFLSTPDGSVVYTGDMRLHGFCGDRTLQFARRANGCDVCVTEGVTAGFVENFEAVEPSRAIGPQTRTEEKALEAIASAATRTEGMVFLNTYNRNLDRMARLPALLKSRGRTLALTPEQAFLLERVKGMRGLSVYAPLLEQSQVRPDAVPVTREELLRRPERYVLQLPYVNLLETLDFDPVFSTYLHADGAPLGPFDPGYANLTDFLNARGIRLESLGTGGHASPEHLKYILQTIAPRWLVPLHSMGPEKIRIKGSGQLLPRPGAAYRLENHTLKEDPDESSADQ